MSSLFQSLETAKRGLFAQQQALAVTSHNIANANTPGYTRQRVNLTPTTPYPTAGMNQPQIPGQIGTGVKAGSIERMRESFLDIQYRNEHNTLGYWESRANALSQMENIMNEPTDNGLSAVMGEFWQSLQDLSVYPENEGTREVVLQRGQAVVDTFHYLSESLTTIKNNFGNEITVTLQDINSILQQIGDLNRQIGGIEPHGYLPNDLYDQRDRLVDELSKHIDITVSTVKSGGNPSTMAVGQYVIKMANGNGTHLVSGDQFVQLGFVGNNGERTYDIPTAVKSISVFGTGETTTIDIADDTGKVNFSIGKLRGLIESYGYESKETDSNDEEMIVEKGIYSDMLSNLDKHAYSFVNLFNEVHSQGHDLEGKEGSNAFFVMDGNDSFLGAAKAIELGTLEAKDIAASRNVDAGDGTNALYLADIPNFLLADFSNTDLEGLEGKSVINSGTLNAFYEGMIGQLGVNALQANRLSGNSEVLLQSINENRQSVSSVSLDEEMTNIIVYQHAYNAAARQITVVDEMLDRIINGMGLVGR